LFNQNVLAPIRRIIHLDPARSVKAYCSIQLSYRHSGESRNPGLSQ